MGLESGGLVSQPNLLPTSGVTVNHTVTCVLATLQGHERTFWNLGVLGKLGVLFWSSVHPEGKLASIKLQFDWRPLPIRISQNLQDQAFGRWYHFLGFSESSSKSLWSSHCCIPPTTPSPVPLRPPHPCKYRAWDFLTLCLCLYLGPTWNIFLFFIASEIPSLFQSPP